ncbi:hypothetical protein ACFX1S_026695 [Malus domestica]
MYFIENPTQSRIFLRVSCSSLPKINSHINNTAYTDKNDGNGIAITVDLNQELSKLSTLTIKHIQPYPNLKVMLIIVNYLIGNSLGDAGKLLPDDRLVKQTGGLVLLLGLGGGEHHRLVFPSSLNSHRLLVRQT